jgi:hypothetical protein
MMLYHPDRIAYYQAEIERSFSLNDLQQLQKHAHILSTIEMEKNFVLLSKPSGDPGTAEEYRWEDTGSGFDYVDEDEVEGIFEEGGEESPGSDFYSTLKRSIYGHEDVELPFYYLADMEELDLNGLGIEVLDGVQHCVRVKVLDLSRNHIIDIDELSRLRMLREVFLSQNFIALIDPLGFAEHLRIADLSNNRIDDISPLFEMEYLEYLNILGNRVPQKQIEFMRSKGVVVID